MHASARIDRSSTRAPCSMYAHAGSDSIMHLPRSSLILPLLLVCTLVTVRPVKVVICENPDHAADIEGREPPLPHHPASISIYISI